MALPAAALQEFQALGDRVYLDICARSPLPASAVRALADYFAICTSEGARKEEWLAHIEIGRERMARLIGATSDEIAYAKSTAEGVNAFAHRLGLRPGENIVLAPGVEHPNNIYPWLNLRRSGVEIRFAQTPRGHLRADEVARLVNRRTRVVVATHVAFNSGTRTNLRALAAVAHEVGALLFIDAAQSLGLRETRLDLPRSVTAF